MFATPGVQQKRKITVFPDLAHGKLGALQIMYPHAHYELSEPYF